VVFFFFWSFHSSSFTPIVAPYDPASLFSFPPISLHHICFSFHVVFNSISKHVSHSYRSSCNSCTHSHAQSHCCHDMPSFCFRCFLSTFSKGFLLQVGMQRSPSPRYLLDISASSRTRAQRPFLSSFPCIERSVSLNPSHALQFPPFIPLSIPRTALYVALSWYYSTCSFPRPCV